MKNPIRFLPVLAAAALLAGCEGPCTKIDRIGGPALTNGSADFTTVASVGTNLSAGFQSGGLVNRHQFRAFPALFARQVGRTVVADGTGQYSFNGISNDGIPTLLAIQSLSPLVISNAGRVSGAPQNQGQLTDYHNLATYGALAADLVDSTYYTSDPNPVRGSGYNKTFFNLVWRSRGTPLTQLVRRAPTFVTFEFGLNEVAGSYSSGGVSPVFPTANYVAAVRAALDGFHAQRPGALVAVCNVPNVLEFPYGRTFSAVTLSTLTNTPVSLLQNVSGTPVALAPGDLVLLTAKDSLAAGTGFPLSSVNYLVPAVSANGRGLPPSMVLDGNEQSAISNAVTGMNAALDSITANRPWTVLVDLNSLFSDIAADGYRVGSVTYTSDFVTGGLFGLDGVHPNDLTHAIVCNALIDAVNAKWGATVPHLNVAEFATATSSRARPAAGEASLPQRIEGLEAALSPLYLRR